jgi:hypothetical protein
MKILLSRLGVLLALSATAHAQLVFFNFNSTPDNPPVTEDQVVGTPTVLLTGTDLVEAGQAGTAFTDFSGTSHAAGLAGAFDSGVDAGNNVVTFTVDTTLLFDLSLRYDYRATPTGPSSSTLEYSIASGPFTLIGNDAYTRDSAYHAATWNLTAINDIEDAGEVRFRWSAFTGGSSTGTFRFDNLQLTGENLNPIPEPSEYALAAGLGLLAFAVWRRRIRANRLA